MDSSLKDRHTPTGTIAVSADSPRVEPHAGMPSLLRTGPAPRKVSLNRPQQLLELACRVAPARAGLILVFSVEDELVEFLTHGLTVEEAGALRRSPEFVELLRAVADGQSPRRWGDARDERSWPASLAESQRGPLLALPFHCSGRCRGVFGLARTREQGAFGSEDEETIRSIACLLEQGNLLEETRLLDQLRLLSQIAQAAAGNLDLARILAVSLTELDRNLPLHAAAVWLVEEEARPDPGEAVSGAGTAGTLSPALKALHAHAPRSQPLTPPQGVVTESTKAPALVLADLSAGYCERAQSRGLTAGFRLPLDASPLSACIRDGQPFYTDTMQAPSAEASPANLGLSLAEPGATSCFAVPLRAGERVIGILHSVCTRPSGFSVEQIQLLYLVGDLLGPAISNCQLFGQLRKAYEELRVAQGQLIQAEKMRALGELAGGMAHEFNNALCGVLGFLELALLNDNLDGGCRSFLESGRTCALDAAHVVRRVQDFARWQRNEQGFRTLEFNDLVRQTIELIRHKWESLEHARGTGIAVTVEAGGGARVNGNAAELREVLTNLSFNAVDAMPGGGELSLRTWTTATDVYLAVRDSGAGMNDAVKQRIFEPFFTTKGEKGNGLGLSVSFGIVQRHGGEISVESHVGKGTTFTIRLPLAREESNGPKSAWMITAGEINAPRSLRILVVEDEETIRRYLSTGLRSMGHQPCLTESGEDGLDAFSDDGPFDLVLTDLGLPGISGEDVARSVAERSPDTPVVLLTGWADQLRAEADSLVGVTRILSKPITLDALAKTLAAVCPG
jgi:signal transduction histidine kinase/CheY-like chemotaxis protein